MLDFFDGEIQRPPPAIRFVHPAAGVTTTK